MGVQASCARGAAVLAFLTFLALLCGASAARYELGGDAFVGRLDVTARTGEASQDLQALCDDGVQQEAGYYRVSGSRDLNMFYWYFESRSDPVRDPVILWMTGGPGCSDATALLKENGPCLLGDNDTWPSRNEFGWNAKASIIYIDQPCGVGYSYGDASDEDRNERGVAKHVGHFLMDFFAAHPGLRRRDLYIIGESYGGHYVPAVAAAVMHRLPLKGIGIGNGLTVPLVQYQYYPDLAYTYAKEVLSEPIIPYPVYLLQKAAWPHCRDHIASCQNDTSECQYAQEFCNGAMLAPYQITGKNPYDIRLQCEKKPLCYDFSNVDAFMNDEKVKCALGIPEGITWKDCNFTVNAMFSGDWMKDFDRPVKQLLRSNVKVLVYAGDMDFICNWIGNKAWTMDLEWHGKQEFNAADDVKVSLRSDPNTPVGEVRTARDFAFFRLYDAGHLSPMDQPEVTLEMVKWLTQSAGPTVDTDADADAAGRSGDESGLVFEPSFTDAEGIHRYHRHHRHRTRHRRNRHHGRHPEMMAPSTVNGEVLTH